MICSCQNMTLSTMIVLKPHEISLCIFISGPISTIILPVRFSSLFSRWWILSLFFIYTLLHSYLILSVRQFDLLFFLKSVLLQFISRYCFPLISHTVVAISFCHISLLSSTVYRSLLPLLYSLIIHKLYSYTSVLHMTYVLFCILLHSMLK